MDWPVDDRKFPGVSITSRQRMEARDMDFHADFAAHAKVTIPDEKITSAAAVSGRGALADLANYTAHVAATLVMRAVALVVLRRVRRDWGGLFGIGMEIIDRGETLGGKAKTGRATLIDYGNRQLTVLWNFNLDGAVRQQYAFDDALEKLQRRDWDLP